jgi:hypothetical protein
VSATVKPFVAKDASEHRHNPLAGNGIVAFTCRECTTVTGLPVTGEPIKGMASFDVTAEPFADAMSQT